MKRRILVNMASQNGARVIEVLLGFVIVPLLLSRLGAAPYGLIVLAEAIIAFFDVGISGLRHALGRYVGYHLAQKSPGEANGYLGTGTVMLNAVIAVSAVCGLIVIALFERMFQVPDALILETKWFFGLIVAAFLVEIQFTKQWVVIYAQQRFDLLNGFAVLRNIIRFSLVLAVFLPLSRGRLEYYGWIFLAAVIVERLFIARAARRLFPEYSPAQAGFSRAKAKELGSFMVYRTIQSMSGTLYGNSDMILINWFLGPHANAVYAISTKIVNVLRRFVSQTMWVLTPSFTELIAQGRKEEMRNLFVTMVKLSAIFAMPICALIGVFAPELITLWVGSGYLDAVPPLYFHLIAMLPSLVFSSLGGVLTSLAKIRVPSIVSVIVAVLRLLLAAGLAVGLKMGLVGFALASALVSVPQYVGFLVVYTCRLAGIPILKFFKGSVLRPFVLAAVLGAALAALKRVSGSDPRLLVGGVLVFGVIYGVLTIAWVLSTTERSIFKEVWVWAKEAFSFGGEDIKD